MPVAEAPQRIEDKTIQPIPPDERHGKTRDLFSLWFGSNIMLLTVVTGALATSVYGLPFWLAVIAIVVGNLVGAVFMALHSAQGPRLGVPQMMQTRGQFGSYGSLIVIVLVVVMYVGFFASNLVLAGQSLNVLTSGIPVDAGILVVGAVSVVVTIFGYDLIHAYARVMTYLAGAALLLTFIWIVAVHGLGHGFGSFGHSTVAGFLGTVTVAALWQIAYAPYVSDYSRYMPADTGARPAFWASYWGCSLGSILPMILGAMIGVSTGDMVSGLHTETGAVASLVIIIFTITIAMTNSMNIYGGALSMIAIGQTFKPAWLPGAVTRAVLTVVIYVAAVVPAIVSQDNFLVSYSNFILLLMYVLVPWTAINLVDFYLVRHGNYDVTQFFRGDGGIYGRFDWVSIGCYLIGIAIEVPFVNTTMFEGPVAKGLNGVDISWIICLIVIGPLYYVAARRLRPAVPVTAQPVKAPA
ncbi:MAG TPA: cytosine permease [Trebonia sp.]|jgi:NCS1 family nucleobase:cation symporter-1